LKFLLPSGFARQTLPAGMTKDKLTEEINADFERELPRIVPFESLAWKRRKYLFTKKGVDVIREIGSVAGIFSKSIDLMFCNSCVDVS
jgi:hypothetical protein